MSQSVRSNTCIASVVSILNFLIFNDGFPCIVAITRKAGEKLAFSERTCVNDSRLEGSIECSSSYPLFWKVHLFSFVSISAARCPNKETPDIADATSMIAIAKRAVSMEVGNERKPREAGCHCDEGRCDACHGIEGTRLRQELKNDIATVCLGRLTSRANHS